jgi:uncharacterized membrane protein
VIPSGHIQQYLIHTLLSSHLYLRRNTESQEEKITLQQAIDKLYHMMVH